MPDRRAFQYTILRIVPSVARGERINVGVVLFSPQHAFLAARMQVSQARLSALCPRLDATVMSRHLAALEAVIDGLPAAGSLGRMSASERFGWVAAPSSTVIQAARVHTGLTDDPASTLERLFGALVAV